MATAAPIALTPEMRPFRPTGRMRQFAVDYSDEVLLSGPAGTGKSRMCLEKLFRAANQYPGSRHLILRKTRESLTEAALETFETKVVPPGHPILEGAQRRMRQKYLLANGSEIVVGGLDKPTKVMSTEYDTIYIQEATECTETDWEMATTRLGRNNKMPWAQLMADCNPDAPVHWLYQRAHQGTTRLYETRHEDNPMLWDEATNQPTEQGRDYIARLDRLTGVRYKRLRLGLWVAAEGIIYDGWDPAIHRIDRLEIPREWTRVWSVDFGFVNPFVWQAWALDPDGRAYRYREIYHTRRLVQDHARQILEVTQGDPAPTAIICDHDAEDVATLERYLKMETMLAHKSVSDGIQAVASRLRTEDDGRARIFFLRDSLVERDPDLMDQKKPCCTEEEFDGYVWNEGRGRRKGEEPLKENDHGMDATRYFVAMADELEPVYQPVSLLGNVRDAGGFRWKE